MFFYSFLNNRGLRCPMGRVVWHVLRHRKISIFNWLALDNKMLTLGNLKEGL